LAGGRREGLQYLSHAAMTFNTEFLRRDRVKCRKPLCFELRGFGVVIEAIMISGACG